MGSVSETADLEQVGYVKVKIKANQAVKEAFVCFRHLHSGLIQCN